jgi:ferritin heavy chain
MFFLKSTFFDRDDQALPGFAKYFRANSDEERDHGIKLINYQNMRGGKVVFQDINKPKKSEWGSALEAVEDAMDLERIVNESLLALHKAADVANDAQMTDFIEGEYLKEQAEAIKSIGDLITKVKRVGSGLGIHIIDKDL